MAKSGRKRKKAEKSKTKLRQSIKLPKGLNETKAQVTSKKIVVLNQLRTQDTEEDRLTRKKIGVRDLMAKLRNNGTSIKQEGLEGLNELLKAFPELSREFLSQLLESLLPINVHIESKLRTLVRSVLGFILSHVDSEQIQALSNLLTAHLCSGLSHLDTNIQLDALKLLDIILQSAPIVVIMGHEQILPNCLNQVSSKAKSGDTMRSLTKNVSEKVTALQWRTEVLQRVLKILNLIHLKEEEIHYGKQPIYGRKILDENYMNLINHRPNYLSLQDIINGRQNDVKKEKNELESFMQSLFNLLFQTWCEAIGIDKKKQSSSNLISLTIVPTLSAIIDLLVASPNNLDEKLLNHIMKSFPLEVLPASMEKKNAENSNNPSISDLNLNICFLVLNQRSSEHIPFLMDYIQGFDIKNASDASKVSSILNIIVEKDLEVNASDLDKVIGQLASNYKTNETVTKAMMTLTSWKNRSQAPSIETWINELPMILTSPKVNQHHLETIRLLFKRRDLSLMKAFEQQSINLADSKNALLLEQIWRTVALFPNQAKHLQNHLEASPVSQSTKDYVVNLIET